MATYTYTTGDNSLPSPPTILQLGMQLAETTDRLGKHGDASDETILSLAGNLRHVIASMPAVTLQDAAIQIGVAYILSDFLDGATPEDDGAYMKELAASLRRALVSALPLVADAAGLGLDALGLDYVAKFKASLFFGEETSV